MLNFIRRATGRTSETKGALEGCARVVLLCLMVVLSFLTIVLTFKIGREQYERWGNGYEEKSESYSYLIFWNETYAQNVDHFVKTQLSTEVSSLTSVEEKMSSTIAPTPNEAEGISQNFRSYISVTNQATKYTQQLEQKQGKIRQRYAEYQQCLSSTKDKFVSLQKKKENSDAKVLRENVSKLNTIINELQESLNTYTSKKLTIETNIHLLMGQKKIIEEEKQEFNKEGARERLQKEIDECKALEEERLKQISELNTEIEEKKKQIITFSYHLEELQKSGAPLLEKVQEHKNQMQVALTEIEKRQQSIQQEIVQCDSKQVKLEKSEHQDFDSKIEEYQSKIDTLQQQIVVLEEQILQKNKALKEQTDAQQIEAKKLNKILETTESYQEFRQKLQRALLNCQLIGEDALKEYTNYYLNMDSYTNDATTVKNNSTTIGETLKRIEPLTVVQNSKNSLE